jgi:hypothetical protein
MLHLTEIVLSSPLGVQWRAKISRSFELFAWDRSDSPALSYEFIFLGRAIVRQLLPSISSPQSPNTLDSI